MLWNGDLIDANCRTHGPYRARQCVVMEGVAPLTEGCPTCREEYAVANERAAIRAKQNLRSLKLRELLAVASIPKLFANASFDNYDAAGRGQAFALAICRRYAETWPEQVGKGGSLVLTGRPGTGKTHLACAIGHAVIAEYQATVACQNISSMLRMVKETYRRDSEKTERQAINELIGPDLLIMDELGAQIGTDHEKQLLFEIIDGRYREMRPTIIASNLNRDDLEVFLGERIMDRLNDCATVIAFDWASHRGPRA